MRLTLQNLYLMHPTLRGHPVDFSKFGGLALQRAGHVSPAPTNIDDDGIVLLGYIEWLTQDVELLGVLDSRRITEDGAEAIALAYANRRANWVVNLRLQQG